jgi:putative aminopeptidase FrvX
VGVCLTSAEELGLAGARAWARGRAPAVALNCDGVDDRGSITCMYSGRRPDRLVAEVVAGGKRAGVAVRAHRLLPGVQTDGVALAEEGWAAVTLSKGSARTLARIHTPRDRADALTGAGIADVAALVTELVRARHPAAGGRA